MKAFPKKWRLLTSFVLGQSENSDHFFIGRLRLTFQSKKWHFGLGLRMQRASLALTVGIGTSRNQFRGHCGDLYWLATAGIHPRNFSQRTSISISELFHVKQCR